MEKVTNVCQQVLPGSQRKHRRVQRGTLCVLNLTYLSLWMSVSVQGERWYGPWCLFLYNYFILNIDWGANDFRPVYPAVSKWSSFALFVSASLLQYYIISASLHGFCVYMWINVEAGGRVPLMWVATQHALCVDSSNYHQKNAKEKETDHPHTQSILLYFSAYLVKLGRAVFSPATFSSPSWGIPRYSHARWICNPTSMVRV